MKAFNPDHCVGCGTNLLDQFDRDPNGDPGCVCAKCKAEEKHDYDVEPGVVFNRDGSRAEPVKPAMTRITLEMPAEAVNRLMEKWKTKRPEMLQAFKDAGIDVVGMEVPAVSGAGTGNVGP